MSSFAGLAIVSPINIASPISDVNPFHRVFAVNNAYGYSILEFDVLTEYNDVINAAKVRVNNRQVGVVEPSPNFFAAYTLIFANSVLRPGSAPYNGNQDLNIVPIVGTLLQVRNMRIQYQKT